MDTTESSAVVGGSAPTSDMSFAEIAAGAVEAYENPEPQAGDAAEASEPAPAGDPGASEPQAAEGEGDEQGSEAVDEVLDALANLDREELSPELQALYDDLMERRRLMQTDYMRKTTAVADERKAVEQAQVEFDQRVADAVQAQLAQFGISQVHQPTTPTAEAAPGIDENLLWEGLGERITLDAALNDENPATLDRYVEQKATVLARAQIAEVMQAVILPELQRVTSLVENSRMQESQRTVDTFLAANPDLEPHFDKVLGALKAGLAPDLEGAAEAVRRIVGGEQQVQRALEMGVAAGRQQRQVVDENRQQFSTPSASTAPKQGQQFTPQQSFKEIANAVADSL